MDASTPVPEKAAEPAPLPAGLYLVGTPIGNLEDITLRALRVLGAADVVYAEDTRMTRRIFERHQLRAPLRSCHQHNEPARADEIAGRVRRGESVALVTDSGMPGISDPGSRVAAALQSAGLPVTVVPGASAVTAAIALSGLGGGAFQFHAFLPHKHAARLRRLAALMRSAEPVVLFESPYRVLKLLGEIGEIDPGREIFAARELTKKFEECRRGVAADLAAHFTAHPPRGEFVFILAPGPRGAPAETDEANRDEDGAESTPRRGFDP